MARRCGNGSILVRSVRPFRDIRQRGRDTLTGPGLTELDLALAKSTTIHERLRAQFRAEFFNVLNHSNFTTPNAVVTARPNPKDATAVQLGHRRRRYQRYATTSRQVQFGLKLLF